MGGVHWGLLWGGGGGALGSLVASTCTQSQPDRPATAVCIISVWETEPHMSEGNFMTFP